MPKRLEKNYRILLSVLVIFLFIGFAYVLLNFEDIVGQATEVVGASACEPGKFYLASTGALELCSCAGNSCARGSCEGAVCKKTKQITINPNGGKVTVRDPVSSTADVIAAQTTIPLEVGTRREISLNPQQPSATTGVDLVFTGWKDGADATSRFIIVTQDAMYTPNWKEVQSQTMLSPSSTQGLALLLTMDEPIGGPKDSSGNGNVVTESGTTVAPGRVGSARHFAGTSTSYINVQDNPNFKTSLQISTPFTISFWIKTTQTTGNSVTTLFYKGPESSSTSYVSYVGELFTSNKLSLSVIFDSTNSPARGVSADANILDGAWHFVTLLYDGKALYAYQDAVLKGSSLTNLPENTLVNIAKGYPLKIGIQLSSTRNSFNGDLDEFAMWNRALSVQEIQSLYNNGQGVALSKQ